MIGRLSFCAALFLGCHGADVESSTTDAAANEVATEAGSSCNPTGNIFVDPGAGGWSSDEVKLEPIAGPCGGWGYRFVGSHNYSSVSRETFTSLARGTKLVVRVYFKVSGVAGPPPDVIVQGIHRADAGEVRTPIIDVRGEPASDWKLLEARGTLTYDESSIYLTISSSSTTTDEFAFGGASIVTE